MPAMKIFILTHTHSFMALQLFQCIICCVIYRLQPFIRSAFLNILMIGQVLEP